MWEARYTSSGSVRRWSSAKIPVLGHLPRRSDLVLPERHLAGPDGGEHPDDRFFQQLVEQIESTVDVDGLLSLSRSAEPSGRSLLWASFRRRSVHPSPYRDRAGQGFQFHYEDNLDLLRAWGADLYLFSPWTTMPSRRSPRPLHRRRLPELFAAELSANRSMIESLRSAIEGASTYAECGGLMYLSG